MNTFDGRIQQIDAVVPLASVRTEGLMPELQSLARKLCRHFELGLVTLIRRANAIAIAEGIKGNVSSEHLQEAAQHVVVKSRASAFARGLTNRNSGELSASLECLRVASPL